jgi:hypothetical protein
MLFVALVVPISASRSPANHEDNASRKLAFFIFGNLNRGD